MTENNEEMMAYSLQIKNHLVVNEMVSAINGSTMMCHGLSNESGWWEGLSASDPRDFMVKLCLIHSEVSEAMEGCRKDLMDDHLPHRKMAEVELADAVIRIMDLAGAAGYDLGSAMVEKLQYNQNRADHKVENRASKGGKKF